MQTTRTEKKKVVALPLALIGFLFLTAAGTGITARQVLTAAPANSINLSGVSAAEGTSTALLRADATFGISGTLPEANGGTGTGALTCTAGKLLSSNGTVYSCGNGSLTCSAGQAVTGNGTAFSCTSSITANALAASTAYTISGPSNTTALGVTSAGTGTAVAADASGGTGYGVVATGNSTKAPLRAVGQASAPSSGLGGDIYFDTTSHALSYHDGVSAWVTLAAGGVGIVADAPLTGTGTSGSHLGCTSATGAAGGCVTTSSQTFGGAKTFNGGVVIGSSGTAISASYRGLLNQTPGTVTAQTCNSLSSITVTGSAAGYDCAFATPNSAVPGLTFYCIAATNACTIRVCNVSASTQTPPAGDYTCRVFAP